MWLKAVLVVLMAFLMKEMAWGVIIENVRARQIPQTKEVEVFYDLIAPEGGAYKVALQVKSAEILPPVVSLSGDVGANCASGKNRRIIWDAAKDWHGHIATNFTATVTATFTRPIPKGMVRIPGLDIYMDKTEVTYEHWKKVCEWFHNHSNSEVDRYPSSVSQDWGFGKGDDHPVCLVSASNQEKCKIWCNARSLMEGLEPVYWRNNMSSLSTQFEKNGYRLPTKEEWIYAARGGLKDALYPWGNAKPSHAYANCYVNGMHHPVYSVGDKPYTAPVGSFLCNGYGLYDMAGNLKEYSDERRQYGSLTEEKPLYGGSYASSDVELQCDQYNYSVKNQCGFRCVRNIK